MTSERSRQFRPRGHFTCRMIPRPGMSVTRLSRSTCTSPTAGTSASGCAETDPPRLGLGQRRRLDDRALHRFVVGAHAARFAQLHVDDLPGRQLHDVENRLRIAGDVGRQDDVALDLGLDAADVSVERLGLRGFRRLAPRPGARGRPAPSARRLRAPAARARRRAAFRPAFFFSASRLSASRFSASRLSLSSRARSACSCFALSAISALLGCGGSTWTGFGGSGAGFGGSGALRRLRRGFGGSGAAWAVRARAWAARVQVSAEAASASRSSPAERTAPR